MKFKLFIILVAICVISTGCASGGALYSDKPFTDSSSSAQIIIFRKHQFTGGGACYKVLLDKKDSGVLANGGFIVFDVEPGFHRLSVQDEKLGLDINAEAGKRHYVEYSISLSELGAMPVGTATSVTIGFDFYLAHVTSTYAMQMLPKLKDSSVKFTCMNTQ